MALVDKTLLTIALTIFLFSCAIFSFGQNDIRFKHFDTNSGLGWTGYYKLEQDTLGFIWAQGGEGLSRYDGYTWKNYLLDTTAKEKLSEFFIRELFKDNKGNLWTIQPNRETGDVLLRYDYLLDRFIPLKPTLNGKGFPNMKVMVDKTEPVFWLSTKEGIYAFDLVTQKTTTFLEFPKDPKMAEALKILADIKQVDDGFLVATYKGVWLADKNKKKLVRPTCPPRDSTLLYQADVRSILYYSSDEIWLGLGREGVARLNGNYEVTLKQSGREMMWKYSFTKDAQGRCYVGSNYTGLHVYDPKSNSWNYLQHEVDKPATLKSNLVTDVLIDREQNLWVSLVNYGISVSTKKEINFYNIPSNKFYGKPLGMLSVYPNSFTVLSKGGNDFLLHAMKSLEKKNTLELNISPIDYATPATLNFSKTSVKVPFDENVSVVHAGKKYLWVSFFNGGTVGIPFNYETQQVENKPLRIIELENGKEFPLEIAIMGCWEDPNENLWLGNEFGVYRVKFSSATSNNFEVELFGNNATDSLSLSGPVSQFYVKDTTVWVLTYTSGVDKMVGYMAAKPKFHHAFPHQSAASVLVSSLNKVYIGSSKGFFESDLTQYFNFTRNLDVGNHGAAGSIEDNLGRLWLSNELGVMFYDPKTKITNVFTDDHDYLYKDWQSIKTPKGWIISFDNEGLTLFNPEELSISRKNVKPVFTDLQVNNKAPRIFGDTLTEKDSFIIDKSIAHLKQLTLDYLHNDFAVTFSTLEMIDPQKIKYQYKLEGYDKDWIDTDWKNRQVHYTNLNQGDYTLRVKATNHHGIWSEREATLLITILPPPWKSAWAYGAYALIIMAMLWFGRKFIIKQEQLRSSLQLRQLELQKAQEVDKLKTTFFTNISHEFRTPLTLIKGPAQNLLEQTSGNFEKEQIKLIQRNADLLLKLINQLLELARLESGTIKIKNTSADINAFISTLTSSFISLADHSQIDYKVHLPEKNFIVSTDFDKLETILINLLSNAFKFSKFNSSIEVHAEIQQQASANKLIITIADTGIGIPQEVQSKIFERFFQVSESHNQSGTGIGLALVKELVEILKGEISVQSNPGKGTTFTIKLPIQIQQEVSVSETQLSMIKMIDELPTLNQDDILAPQTQKRATVLVVEDSDDLRKFILHSLGTEYTFSEASNGLIGYEQALEHMPDIIVSDVMMPELDGLQMTEKLKRDFRTSHIPVILLTANVTEESKLKGLGIGADDYLIKPFNKTELQLKVKNKIEQRALLKEKLKLELLTQPEKIETVSADEQFMLKVRKVILDNLGEEKLNVEMVAEAVSLSRSQLFRKVNALTGSSVNELIRQFRLQRAAQLLEQKWAPVSQIAYEVGFSNLSYFSRCFKEQFGVLPSDYPKN